MKKLSMVDKGFLLGESREMPMHVSGVSLFTLPDGAEVQEFLEGIADNLKDADALLAGHVGFVCRASNTRTHTHTHTCRQTDRQTDRQTHL